VQQGGGIIDVAITPTDRTLQVKSTYMLPEHPSTSPAKAVKPSVEQAARWVKKGSQLQYGYKRHDLAEEDTGLVLAVHTTAARVHDGQCMASCLDRVVLTSGSRLRADTGYCSAKNDEL
jgi:transposase, IS5 family